MLTFLPPLRRTSLALLAAGALVLGSALPAAAGTAVATNTKNGSSVFKLAFDVKRVAGNVVDPTNAAVAYASCTDCTTVAIAVQIVIVTGDPSVFTPTNVAIAYNQNCTDCTTIATAVQYVVQAGGPVRFTPEGRQLLADLRKQLRDLEKSGLTGDALIARLNEIQSQLADIIRTQLVPVGPGERDELGDANDVPAGSGASPTAAPSADTTPEPGATPSSGTSPEPTAAPTSGASPGQSASATPAASASP